MISFCVFLLGFPFLQISTTEEVLCYIIYLLFFSVFVARSIKAKAKFCKPPFETLLRDPKFCEIGTKA